MAEDIRGLFTAKEIDALNDGLRAERKELIRQGSLPTDAEVDFEYWTPTEVRQRVYGAPRRWVTENCGNWSYQEPQVLVGDKWYRLCRTDMMDDVRTSGGVENSRAIVKVRNSLGARVTANTIYIIDALTDG